MTGRCDKLIHTSQRDEEAQEADGDVCTIDICRTISQVFATGCDVHGVHITTSTTDTLQGLAVHALVHMVAYVCMYLSGERMR